MKVYLLLLLQAVLQIQWTSALEAKITQKIKVKRKTLTCLFKIHYDDSTCFGNSTVSCSPNGKKKVARNVELTLEDGTVIKINKLIMSRKKDKIVGCKATPGNTVESEPSFGCGFNDDDLVVNTISRSPHDTGQWFKWKDGKIPYYFYGNVTDGDKKLARDVMDEIESHTCYKYIPRTYTEPHTEPLEHHLMIMVGEPTCYQNGFGAYVQPLSYNKVLLRSSKQLTDHKTCFNRGGLMHEMMHALGVGHTQKRADRDKYITINKDNIKDGKYSQYAVCQGCALYNAVPYDCSSVMHYGEGTFSNGKGPTMTAKDPANCKLSTNGPDTPASSDWKLLEIIAGKVCDMKAPRWLAWSEWSACSEPCGVGRKNRKRTCNVPGKCEKGETYQEVKCSLQDIYNPQSCYYWRNDCDQGKWKDWMQKRCAHTCKCRRGAATWSSWGDWSACSASCGDAQKNRMRTCSISGKCPGEKSQTKECDLPKCGIALWSSWSAWSGCSTSCGDGTKSRKRSCSISGKCPGDSQQTNKCDLPDCATWSSWGDWSGCSASCGDGTKSRKRTCSVSGECWGPSEETNKCDLPHCGHTCPEGHTAYGSNSNKHCYFPSFKDGEEMVGEKSWLDARKYCRELSKKYPTYKYDLVSLQNEDEYSFILKNGWSEVYKKWGAYFGIWIGLNDRDEEGKWTWSDGAPLKYANPSPTAQTPPWRKGEPSQPYGDEDCVRTYGFEGLTDRDCNIKMNFICEGQKDEGSCQTKNGLCIFPFTYLGNTYNGCTTADYIMPWCTLKVEKDGIWWGDCPDDCRMHQGEGGR